jgi:hypothetical protein
MPRPKEDLGASALQERQPRRTESASPGRHDRKASQPVLSSSGIPRRSRSPPAKYDHGLEYSSNPQAHVSAVAWKPHWRQSERLSTRSRGGGLDAYSVARM